MKKFFVLCVLSVLAICLMFLSACASNNSPDVTEKESVTDSSENPVSENQNKPMEVESKYTIELLEGISDVKGSAEERAFAIAKMLPSTDYKFEISDIRVQSNPLSITIEQRYNDSIPDSWSYWEMYAKSKLENNLMLLFNFVEELETVSYKNIAEEADNDKAATVYTRADIEPVFGKTPQEISINGLYGKLSDNMLPDDGAGEAIAWNRIRPGDTLAYVEMRNGSAGERENIEGGGFKMTYNNYEDITAMYYWYKDSASGADDDAVLRMSGYSKAYPVEEVYEKWGEPYEEKDGGNGSVILIYRLKSKERFKYFVVDDNNDGGESKRTVSMEGLVDNIDYLYSLVKKQ